MIAIPSIADSAGAFQKLFNICEQVRKTDSVILDFSECKTLSHNGQALLGGVIALAQKQNRKVRIEMGKAEQRTQEHIRSSGLLRLYGDDSHQIPDHVISFRTFESPQRVKTYLNDWLSKGRLNIGDQLQVDLLGRVYEIYVNALEHGDCPSGVCSCGRYEVTNKKLKLCIVDYGKGVKRSVQDYVQRLRGLPELPLIADKACLQWAFERGNSTKGVPNRGVGLDLLQEFVGINKGRLELYSHRAYGAFQEGRMQFSPQMAEFNGTAVNIEFNCDDMYYDYDKGIEDVEPVF